MKKINFKYLPVISSLFLIFAETSIAKNPHHKEKHQNKGRGHDSRWENSNKQSSPYSLKGRDRAEERHRLKDLKKHSKQYKNNQHRDSDYHYQSRDRDRDYQYERSREYDRHREYDKYERQRYEERYRNNPINTTIERSIDNAKSKIDNVHRRAIDTIDEKTSVITGTQPRRDQPTTSRRWWWPFGDSQ